MIHERVGILTDKVPTAITLNMCWSVDQNAYYSNHVHKFE